MFPGSQLWDPSNEHLSTLIPWFRPHSQQITKNINRSLMYLYFLFRCSNLSKLVQSLQPISLPDMVVVLDISTGKCSYGRTWFAGRRSRSKTYRTSITRDGCQRGLSHCQQHRQTTYQPSNSLKNEAANLMNIKATGIWQFYSVCGWQIVVYWDYIISYGKKAM